MAFEPLTACCVCTGNASTSTVIEATGVPKKVSMPIVAVLARTT